jgi:hypothetical protein
MVGWLVGWLVWVGPGWVVCLTQSVNQSQVELVAWLVGWFGLDQAGSCALTQSVNPSQVESGWVGWLVGWLVVWLAGWLVGWLAGRLSRTMLGGVF